MSGYHDYFCRFLGFGNVDLSQGLLVRHVEAFVSFLKAASAIPSVGVPGLVLVLFHMYFT